MAGINSNVQTPPPPPPPPPSNSVSVTTSNQTTNSVAGAPAVSSALWQDQFKVVEAQHALVNLISVPGSDWHQVTAAQNTFNNALSDYHAALSTDLGEQLDAWQASQSQGNHPDPNVGKEFSDALAWDRDQLSNFASAYKQPFFSDQNATSTFTGRVSGTAFPGGDQGGVFESYLAATGGVVNGIAVSDPTHLPKGYVSPPAIGASSNVADVYKNLTPGQAAYLGWAIEQGGQQKQVNIPPEDVQNWTLLSTYATENNKYLKSGKPPADYSQNPSKADVSTDALVAQAWFGNKPTDPGTWLGIAFGVAGAFLPIDELAEPATGLAAALGIGSVGARAGESGLLDSTGLAVQSAGGARAVGSGAGAGAAGLMQGILDTTASAIASLRGVVSSMGASKTDPVLESALTKVAKFSPFDSSTAYTFTPAEQTAYDAYKAGQAAQKTASEALLNQVGSITKSDDFDQLVAKGNEAGLGDVANDSGYQALLDNVPQSQRLADFQKKYGLTDQEANALSEYTGGVNNSSEVVDALKKLPTMAGTTYRYQAFDDATLQKILSGKPLTTSDLTGGNSDIVAAKVGGYANTYDKPGTSKVVINSSNDADGSTYVAPTGPYWAASENEAVYYNGTFTVAGATQDADGRWTIYLNHHA